MRSLLDDPELGLRLLVEGRPGALDERVVWVHNTELPDPSPYLGERELVLTNGMWLEQAEAAGFVDAVARAGAAGIVFGLREQVPRTPREVIDACAAARLPLVEIAIGVPFTAVTRAAAGHYAEMRQSSLLGLVRRGDALTTALSRGAGVAGVLDVLRRDHDLPLAVVDRAGRLLAAAGAELTADQRHVAAERLGDRPPPLEADLGAGVTASLFLVGAVGDLDAALLCLRPLRELDSGERDALEQAARFLSLEVAKQQAVHAIELRFASELLDMILSGPQRAAEVPGRLRAFGVDPSGALAVLALAFGDAATAPTQPGLAEAVTEFFLAENTPAAVAGGTGDVVAVLPWRRGEEELREVADRLARAVDDRFPGLRAVVGIGGSAENAAGLKQPLVRSRDACHVLRRRSGVPRVATVAELGTHRLLLGLHDADTLRDFADVVLGPLREHDAQRGSELVATVRAFLDNGGQWAATAEALYVHVNTLRNRLAKVTELTGRDVARTEDRVDLYLALEAEGFSG
ncbi:PucR family transcriptional regulator [Allokutzneria albata]|uniref:DNA-binding transcriptional regulator, PucR family n=1 Tax=Allokutzneria albata TaxID=211114 RepID=A0A1G9Y3S7_ALLAB|nr:PucR family transcriptional regulator [Allokutzneria albata]SDN03762.1 DNA-binding transcriptional regulator, PucR family [Allokutzneria albata]